MDMKEKYLYRVTVSMNAFEKFSDLYDWIIENCNHGDVISYTNLRKKEVVYSFKSQEDGAAFKLRWL